MHISHIAIWTTRLEELRNFYITYFNGTSNEKYINPKKGFESYFISFDHGAGSNIYCDDGCWSFRGKPLADPQLASAKASPCRKRRLAIPTEPPRRRG